MQCSRCLKHFPDLNITGEDGQLLCFICAISPEYVAQVTPSSTKCIQCNATCGFLHFMTHAGPLCTKCARARGISADTAVIDDPIMRDSSDVSVSLG